MTTTDDQTTGKLPSKISRRTLAAGAAWSVPVIAVASAAPAYALSCIPSIDFSSDSCRCTGEGQNDKDYFVKICIGGAACVGAGSDLYVAIRANTGGHALLYASAIAVPATPGACSDMVHFNSTNSSINLRLYYGATAAEALVEGPNNYVIVDAPSDCEDLNTPLGSCVNP